MQHVHRAVLTDRTFSYGLIQVLWSKVNGNPSDALFILCEWRCLLEPVNAGENMEINAGAPGSPCRSQAAPPAWLFSEYLSGVVRLSLAC